MPLSGAERSKELAKVLGDLLRAGTDSGFERLGQSLLAASSSTFTSLSFAQEDSVLISPLPRLLVLLPVRASLQSIVPSEGTLAGAYSFALRLTGVAWSTTADRSALRSLGFDFELDGATLPLFPGSGVCFELDTATLALGIEGKSFELSAAFSGLVKIGAGWELEANLILPDGLLTVGTTHPIRLPELLTDLGVTAPPGLDNLELTEADLEIGMRSGDLRVEAWVAKVGATHLDVPGLSLEELRVLVERLDGDVRFRVAASARLHDCLDLKASIGYDLTSGLWTASAGMAAESESVANLIDKLTGFAPPAELHLDNVYVTELDGEIQFTSSAIKSYSVAAGVRVSWTIAGTAAEVATRFSLSDSDGVKEFRFVGRASLGGVRANLVCIRRSKAESATEIIVTLPDLAGLQATFKSGSTDQTLTFTNTEAFTLGELVGGLEALFSPSHNPNMAFPDPWSAIGDFQFDREQLKLSFDVSKGTFKFVAELSSLSIADVVKVSALEVEYKQEGSRKKLHARLRYTVAGKDQPAIDPMDPSQSPSVLAKGSPLRVDLAVIGRNLDLEAPKLDDGIGTELARLVDRPPDKFRAGTGWVFAADLTIAGFLQLRLLYTDALAGAELTVPAKPQAPAQESGGIVDALSGLDALILYRKISPNIGVFQGSVGFSPAKVIRFGSIEVTIPKIAASIYTNGDFLVDIGFPHDRDFSSSLHVRAGQYSGAGGIYFGRLSGETSLDVPQVDPVIGRFDPVLKVGLGVALAIQQSATYGPLSLDASLEAEAIFEGLFASYTSVSGEQDEYYSISAWIELRGRVHGKVDLLIVKAELLVEVVASALATAIAHEAAHAQLDASFSVDIDVSLDVGLFTIHKSFHTQAHVGFALILGERSTPKYPWPRAAELDSSSRVFDSAPAAATPAFQAPRFTHSFTVYVTAPLTANQPELRGEVVGSHWEYVLQFALAAPSRKKGSLSLGAHSAGGFSDFVRLSVAWLVNSSAGSTSADFPSYLRCRLDRQLISGLLVWARAPTATPSPTDNELHQFFERCAFSLQSLPSAADVVFIPMPPDVKVSSEEGSVGKASAHKRLSMIRDFLHLVWVTALEEADRYLDSSHLADVELAQLLDDSALADGPGASILEAVAAATARFLYHGHRVKKTLPDVSLFTELGQQITVKRFDRDARIRLSLPSAKHWGFEVADGSRDLALSVEEGQLASVRLLGSDIGLDESNCLIREQPLESRIQSYNARKIGEYGEYEQYAIPSSLSRAIARGLNVAGVNVIDRNNDYWWSVVEFDVRLVDSSSESWFFEVMGAPPNEIAKLEGICRQGLELQFDLVVPTAEGVRPIGNALGSNVNGPYSADMSPIRGVASTRIRPPTWFWKRDNTQFFLGVLREGRTGYYFRRPKSGPALRTAADGQVRLGFLVCSRDANPGIAWNGVLISRMHRGTKGDEFPISVPGISSRQPPGSIAVEVTRPVVPRGASSSNKAAPTRAEYEQNLSRIFDLVSIQSPDTDALVGRKPLWSFATGKRVDYLDSVSDTAASDKRRYVQRFSLVDPSLSTEGDPFARAANPYARVGESFKFEWRYRDLFGNQLKPGANRSVDIPVCYSDAMRSLDEWPGLHHSYQFVVEGRKRQLRIEMVFHPPLVKSEHRAETLSTLRQTYALIYHQLGDAEADVELSLLTSPIKARDIVKTLRSNARDIGAALQRGDSNPLVLHPLEIPLPPATATMEHPKDLICPLIAGLVLRRKGAAHIHSDLTGQERENVLRSRTTLVPHMQAGALGESRVGAKHGSYRRFAEGVEAAFKHQGVRILVANSRAPHVPLYAIRWGKKGAGLSVKADPSRGSAFGLPRIGGATPPAMGGKDADVMVDDFLEQIETLLQPQTALRVGLTSGTKGLVETLLDAKREMSTLLGSRLTSLERNSNPVPTAAKDSVTTALLGDLRQHARLDGAICLEAELIVPEGASAPAIALSGRVQATCVGGSPTEFVARGTLASQRSEQALSGLLTCLVPSNSMMDETAWTPKSFVLDEIELLDGGTSLRFLTSAVDAISVTCAQIAFPAKNRPVLPMLKSTSATTDPVPVGTDERQRILDACRWTMVIDYSGSFSEVDTTRLDITSAPAPPRSGDVVGSLEAALSAFADAFKSFDVADSGSRERLQRAVAPALKALEAVTDEERKLSKEAGSRRSAPTLSVVMNESIHKDGSLHVTATAMLPAIVRELAIDGENGKVVGDWRRDGDAKLEFEFLPRSSREGSDRSRWGAGRRTLRVSLPIASWPAASCNLRIVRNEFFPPEFHMSTAQTGNAMRVEPFVNRNEILWLERLESAGSAIVDGLAIDGFEGGLSMAIRLGAAAAAPSSDEANAYEVTVPLALIPYHKLRSAEEWRRAVSDVVAHALDTAPGPVIRSTHRFVEFDLRLYPPPQDGRPGEPILRLGRLRFPLDPR